MEAVPQLLTRRRVIVALIVLGLVGLVGGYGVATRTRPKPTRVALTSPQAAERGGGLFVHVAGAVARPGLYELRPGSRVNDALAAAGGANGDGNVDALNLAAKVKDGDKILVPVKGAVVVDPAAPPSSGGGVQPAGALVNLNTATPADLDTLPGVGPAIAQRIIDFRQSKGGFRTVDELMDVPGIGPAKFAEIKDRVTV